MNKHLKNLVAGVLVVGLLNSTAFGFGLGGGDGGLGGLTGGLSDTLGGVTDTVTGTVNDVVGGVTGGGLGDTVSIGGGDGRVVGLDLGAVAEAGAGPLAIEALERGGRGLPDDVGGVGQGAAERLDRRIGVGCAQRQRGVGAHAEVRIAQLLAEERDAIGLGRGVTRRAQRDHCEKHDSQGENNPAHGGQATMASRNASRMRRHGR